MNWAVAASRMYQRTYGLASITVEHVCITLIVVENIWILGPVLMVETVKIQRTICVMLKGMSLLT